MPRLRFVLVGFRRLMLILSSLALLGILVAVVRLLTDYKFGRTVESKFDWLHFAVVGVVAVSTLLLTICGLYENYCRRKAGLPSIYVSRIGIRESGTYFWNQVLLLCYGAVALYLLFISSRIV